jgi:RNA polymerase sigma-70 factor (ECF subfamily)
MGTEEALRLVRALPPEQAEVVVLRAIAGLDVHQVAELVGKTPGAVRVLAHRGLRRLAQAAKPGVTELPQLTVDE